MSLNLIHHTSLNYSICFFRASKSSASAAPDLSSRCPVSRRRNHGLWCTALQCGVEFVPVSFPSNPHECHLMTNSRRIRLLCTVAKSHHALCRRTRYTSHTYHQTIPSFGLPYPQPCPRTMKSRSTAYNIRQPGPCHSELYFTQYIPTSCGRTLWFRCALGSLTECRTEEKQLKRMHALA